MKVLILSCNTGEGHNAAGRALMETLQREGQEVEMLDYMKLSGERTSRWVGGAYVGIAKYTPRLFHLLYLAGMAISSCRYKSPVYYANALMGKHLHAYLKEHSYDVIVMPHLYPAETITYMKKRYGLSAKTVAISTDYTCIPFWEETNCDCYILPHEDLVEEYVGRGIPREKLHCLGIPVKEAFAKQTDRRRAKRKIKLPEEKPMFLIMGGSMGFGKMWLFTYELSKQCTSGEQIVVICGTNRKLYRVLQKEFKTNENVHIVGYTNHVSEYMDACDVVYTKPGGLTSTEVIVKNKPLIHTAPIPGCETYNQEFFASRGMSLAASTIQSQISAGKRLLKDKERCESMKRAQQKHRKPRAAYEIYQLMRSLCEKSSE